MLGANDAAHSGVQGVSNDAMRRLSTYEGGLAQLGEHLLCKQGVVGSIPSSSTITYRMIVHSKPKLLVEGGFGVG